MINLPSHPKDEHVRIKVFDLEDSTIKLLNLRHSTSDKLVESVSKHTPSKIGTPSYKASRDNTVRTILKSQYPRLAEACREVVWSPSLNDQAIFRIERDQITTPWGIMSNEVLNANLSLNERTNMPSTPSNHIPTVLGIGPILNTDMPNSNGVIFNTTGTWVDSSPVRQSRTETTGNAFKIPEEYSASSYTMVNTSDNSKPYPPVAATSEKRAFDKLLTFIEAMEPYSACIIGNIAIQKDAKNSTIVLHLYKNTANKISFTSQNFCIKDISGMQDFFKKHDVKDCVVSNLAVDHQALVSMIASSPSPNAPILTKRIGSTLTITDTFTNELFQKCGEALGLSTQQLGIKPGEMQIFTASKGKGKTLRGANPVLMTFDESFIPRKTKSPNAKPAISGLNLNMNNDAAVYAMPNMTYLHDSLKG